MHMHMHAHTCIHACSMHLRIRTAARNLYTHISSTYLCKHCGYIRTRVNVRRSHQHLARACFLPVMPSVDGRYTWRTKLCGYGKKCQIDGCQRAHRLSELLPPDEGSERLDSVWRNGVDRWYGQALSHEQINLLLRY